MDTADPRILFRFIKRISPSVVDVYRVSLQCCASHHGAGSGCDPDIRFYSIVLRRFDGHPYRTSVFTGIIDINPSVVGMTEVDGIADHRLKYCFKVEHRSADDLEHIVRRCLVCERLVKPLSRRGPLVALLAKISLQRIDPRLHRGDGVLLGFLRRGPRDPIRSSTLGLLRRGRLGLLRRSPPDRCRASSHVLTLPPGTLPTNFVGLLCRWFGGARKPEHTRSLATAIDAAEGGAGLSNCRPSAAGYNQLQGGSAMTAEAVERRLTAILAADIAGYSWLIGLDE